MLSYLSPAKLNLFLHINARRKDGYHELQTVFQLLDLADNLEFCIPDPAPAGLLSLQCDEPSVPLTDNLILRAARHLRDFAQLPCASASIRLTKRIPMGAGLGGGSSNAATTLLALNELWELNLSTSQLAEIGLDLGADVPVFVHRSSAWAEGIGEILQPIELPAYYYVILWPGISVSTAAIFSHQQLTRDSATIKIADFLAGRVRNDCEAVVCQAYPEVRDALEWLGKYGAARLTGTGSCVFASFNEKVEAEEIIAKVPVRFKGILARGINCAATLTPA